MHCDTCEKRIDAVTAALDPAVDANARAPDTTADHNDPSDNDAVDPAPDAAADHNGSAAKAGVRCLRCKHEYYDKSSYNRHVKVSRACSNPARFEFVLRKSNSKSKGR
jgi:hypothetical protein